MNLGDRIAAAQANLPKSRWEEFEYIYGSVRASREKQRGLLLLAQYDLKNTPAFKV